MNYISCYQSLIEKAKKENPSRKKDDPKNYYEKQHKKPTCLGGKNASDNFVLLTPRQHYIAHKLLYKAYEKKYEETADIEDWWKSFRLFYAWYNMAFMSSESQERPCPTSHDYNRLRSGHIEFQKKTVIVKDGNGKAFQITKDHPRYLNGDVIPINKGIKLSEKTKEKISEQQKGRKWICKNGDELKVFEEDIPNWKEAGWEEGRCFIPSNDYTPSEETRKKISESKKGRKWIHKGEHKKFVTKDKLPEYLKNNWKIGKTEKKKVEEKPNKTPIKWRWINNGEDEFKVDEKELPKWKENGWEEGRLPITKECKDKLSKNSSGRIWVHKNGSEALIKKDQISKWLKDNWEKGRK